MYCWGGGEGGPSALPALLHSTVLPSEAPVCRGSRAPHTALKLHMVASDKRGPVPQLFSVSTKAIMGYDKSISGGCRNGASEK